MREGTVAAGSGALGTIRLLAHDQDEAVEIAVVEVQPSPVQWANYLLGVAMPGFGCVSGGNVPMETGLSALAARALG